MRLIQLFIALFFVSGLAQANQALRCKPQNLASAIQLKLEKELVFQRGFLSIKGDNCSYTHNDNYEDICSVGSSTLMVSTTNKLPSILVTKRGKVHKMICSGKPEQEQQEQQEQEQQQQQQEQQQQQQQREGDPGHGGNTIGPRKN